jgi:tRNA dimethylallyltransferase
MRILAGKAVGEIHRSGRSGLKGFTVTKIGLSPSRDCLYQRIDARVNAMIAAGWADEVRRLVEMGVPADAKPFQFIGYSVLRNQIASGRALAEVVEKIQQATRRFAKRQITWFRKEPDVHWLSGFGDDADVIAAALKFARALAA